MQVPWLTGCFLIFPGDAHGLWKFSHRNLSMAGPWAPPRTAPQRHQEPLPPLPRHSAPSLLGNTTSEKYLLSSYCVPSARQAVFHRYNGPILQARRLRFREGKELTLRERGSCPSRASSPCGWAVMPPEDTILHFPVPPRQVPSSIPMGPFPPL